MNRASEWLQSSRRIDRGTALPETATRAAHREAEPFELQPVVDCHLEILLGNA